MVLLMTGCALDNTRVIELSHLPGAGVVAAFAGSGEMFGIDQPQICIVDKEKIVWRLGDRLQRMTISTGGRCVGVGAVCVAAFAGEVGMPFG